MVEYDVEGQSHRFLGLGVIELSGGNQQKIVIAESLVQDRLVIFDDPTRGVDVGSIVEIHSQSARRRRRRPDCDFLLPSGNSCAL